MHGHKNIPSAIRYFLALLWAHPILHVSTIRVKLSSMHSACANLNLHLCPVRFYHIIPHYLIKGKILWKKEINEQ